MKNEIKLDETALEKAFSDWLIAEHGVQPIGGISLVTVANAANPQLIEGFRAAWNIQQTKLLEKLKAAEEGLGFYADESNYDTGGAPFVLALAEYRQEYERLDGGDIAKQTLKIIRGD